MSSAEAITALIRRLSEYGRLHTPLEETIRAMGTSPTGEVLQNAMPTPQQIEALSRATPILRRKVLADVTGPEGKLLTVHQTRRSGAGALNRGSRSTPDVRDSYIKSRTRAEAGLFGTSPDEPTLYGYLSRDPQAEAAGGLELRYPDSGTEIRPEMDLAQYGRFGVVPRPHVLDRSTLTLGDSLDSIDGASPGIEDILKDRLGTKSLHINRPGSRMEALARDYEKRWDETAQRMWNEPWDPRGDYGNDNRMGPGRASWADRGYKGETPWEDLSYWDAEDFRRHLREHGGLKLFGDELKAQGMGYTPHGYFPAMVPRPYRDITGRGELPMTPREEHSLKDVLASPRGTNYAELQVHGGMRPQDIESIYDFGVDPSLALERKLKKLGIEYRPLSGPQSDLGRLRGFKAPTRGDFLRNIEESPADLRARLDAVVKEMSGWKTSPTEKPPKLWDHYASGGAV